jgi:hypothetical protein
MATLYHHFESTHFQHQRTKSLSIESSCPSVKLKVAYILITLMVFATGNTIKCERSTNCSSVFSSQDHDGWLISAVFYIQSIMRQRTPKDNEAHAAPICTTWIDSKRFWGMRLRVITITSFCLYCITFLSAFLPPSTQPWTTSLTFALPISICR